MLKIFYEDESLLVVKKPSGVESQESGSFRKDMVSEIRNHLTRQAKKEGRRLTGPPYVGVVHRLDRPAEGIMVYAKTKEAAAKLSRQVSVETGKKCMKKIYYALVKGTMEKKEDRLQNLLYFDRKTNTSFVKVDELWLPERKEQNVIETEAKMAILRYETEDVMIPDFERKMEKYREETQYDGENSLLKIELMTGRHHQIRAMFSAYGHPLIGDARYDEKMEGYQGENLLCLRSQTIGFFHPVTGKWMEFSLTE